MTSRLPSLEASARKRAGRLSFHAGNYIGGETVSGIMSALSLAILTRLLTPAEYGILSLFVSVVAVSSIILELNFRGAVNRYWSEADGDYPDFLHSILLGCAGFVMVFLAFGWVFRNSWGALLGLDGHLFFLALICGALRIPWNLAWKQDVAMEASRAYSVRLSIRSLLTSVAGAAWVYLLSSDRYMGQIYALLAVGGLMGALTLAILVRTARGGKWNARHLKYALLFGIPLMPHALSTFLLSLSDRVVVSHFAGYADTGLYALAYDVGAITGTAAMALNQAWLPQFLDLRKAGNTTQIAVLSRTLSISFTSICCLALLMARELMFLLGGESFRVALPVIPVVIMGQAALFLATLYANYTFYRKRTGLISLATMFAAVINVALNIWLVPLYGYAAAAWTTWFSYILLTATEYGIARFLLGEQVVAARSLLGHQLLLGAVALLVPWVESQAGNPAWLLIAKLAIALFLCWRMWQAFQAGKAMA